MKKVYAVLILIVCALALNLFYISTKAETTSNLYAKPVTITDIQNDIVTVQDAQGYLWTFYGAEDRQINDTCVCIMDTRRTASIFDDVIINVTFEA